MQALPALQLCSVENLKPQIEVPSYLGRDLEIGVVHFGVGNFHRSHQASYINDLMNAGAADHWAICGVGVMPQDCTTYQRHQDQDGLYSLSLRATDGTVKTSVVGSIRKYIYGPENPAAVIQQLAAPTVKIVSLTITEGAYVTDPYSGSKAENNPAVQTEVATGLTQPQTAFGYIVAGLNERRRLGLPAFTVLSCDNIQNNGGITRASVLEVARLVDPELATWIAKNVAFPSSMVDRITPVATTQDTTQVSLDLGAHDLWGVVAEPFTQWVLEDNFPYGRPALERVGVTFVSNVADFEALKLRLLNGSHQAVAYQGQLAGYTHVHEALADQTVYRFLQDYMTKDVLPTLRVPAGFDVAQYIDTLLDRFSNPNVGDLLSRLSQDSSSRIPKFVLPTVLDALAQGTSFKFGAQVLASWLRYLTLSVTTDQFTLDDPQREELTAAVTAARTDPTAFLRAIPQLNVLLNYPDFVTEFCATYVDRNNK